MNKSRCIAAALAVWLISSPTLAQAQDAAPAGMPADETSPPPAPASPGHALPGPKHFTPATCQYAPEVCKARKEEMRRRQQACIDDPASCPQMPADDAAATGAPRHQAAAKRPAPDDTPALQP